MSDLKRKTTIRGGVYQDDKSWWHYYFGNSGVSGNFREKIQAEIALKALCDQSIEQFGKGWEVLIERKDF